MRLIKVVILIGTFIYMDTEKSSYLHPFYINHAHSVVDHYDGILTEDSKDCCLM